MRKIWYHQIWIQNYFGFILLILVHTQWIEILFDGAILFLFLRITIFLKVEENLLKFRYVVSTSRPQYFDATVSNVRNLGLFFKYLWPSQNIWTPSKTILTQCGYPSRELPLLPSTHHLFMFCVSKILSM